MSFSEIFRGEKPEGLQDYFTAGILSAMKPFYKVGLGIHRKLYEAGIKKKRRLSRRTVCIGNLTLGGSGKTPATMLAARLLSESSVKTAIISRGYGRSGKKSELVVVSDGEKILVPPSRAGDEPYMLATSLPGVPVVCCPDRYKAGSYVIDHFEPEIVLMDDGFQHWALERNCDIVCIDASRPLKQMRLFPRGPLREPVSGLKRAQAVVLTREGSSKQIQDTITLTRKIAGNIPIFRLNYKLSDPVPIFREETFDLSNDKMKSHHVLAFCGIADPESFYSLLRKKYPRIEGTVTFSDHVRYTPERMRDIQKEFVYRGANVIITTEKDAVKIKELKLKRMPIYYCGLVTEFENSEMEEQFLEVVRKFNKTGNDHE